MKLFITGHLGHIGRDLKPLFDDHDVVGFDIADDPSIDICNIDMIRNTMSDQPDLIIHLANIPHPSDGHPIERYKTINVDGCVNLLTVAKEKKAKGFVFVSSLAAIGWDVPILAGTGGLRAMAQIITGDEDYPVGRPPWTEETAIPLPMDSWKLEKYGVSKSNQEHIIKESGLPYMILRCGPYGHPREGLPPYYGEALSASHLKPTIRKILSDGGIKESQILHICPIGMWGGEKLQRFIK